MVFPNIVPRVQKCSERSGRSERSERAEQCSEHSWACSGHVAKISMLRLNIGSGKLSSCMLSIGLGSKCEQGNVGLPGWGPSLLAWDSRPFWVPFFW